MESVDVLKHLPNGGAVAAIVYLVWLFLQRQQKRDEGLAILVEKFLSELSESRKQYLDHLDHLSGQSTKDNPE